MHNNHKQLQKFLNGKNVNNKINRWSLELTTYNITYEWISGACNKAADSLSQLVDVKDTPVTSNAPINMVVTSTSDGPTTHTHSKTLVPTDTTPPTDVQSMVTLNPGTVSAPPPLMEDHQDTLQVMQKTDPFCKCTSKWLLNGKAPYHEADTFTHIKGLLYKYAIDSNQGFLLLIIPKSWCFTVLVEAHDKLGP